MGWRYTAVIRNIAIEIVNLMQNQAVFYSDTVPPVDAEVKRESPVGKKLAGQRLAVKDLFHMAGLTTTAGNPDWAHTHSIPKSTNSTVERLVEAGAVFVGKTITDELAYSLNGQNIHYGTPLNVYSPDRLPGGSSSGSAVAVAARLADIGLGTDTGGSIRVPASYNGLFGLRPTYGVLPTDNMVPLAPSFDTVGWMTRSLSELHTVASVLLADDYAFDEQPLCGVVKPLLENAAHKTIIEEWLGQVSFEIQDIVDFDPYAMGLADAFRVLQGHQIWQQHGQWFKQHNPVMADDIRIRFNQCAMITAEQVERAKGVQQVLIAQLTSLFETCEILLIPTTPGIAPLLNTPAEELAEYRQQLLAMTAIAGLAGLPQLHLPLFELDGAACGVSLIGQRGRDLALIKQAKTLIGKNFN